ncbi:ATP-dependent zinc metalloprotease FtsH [Marinimicrobium sp. ABcell2]|uniref:ATP-dependent zinc metalloprotease FtsH n=1 Tax=Marinimicrobium sp. ABcell2 TaxID=3069751 RepID=UPI0027B28416|nr:ATP-dependent zinc metalloprotease FtsH [Marinimicrobium sp. ABcell2]MDQ2076464.1 ATP-dependent zinc metalloprotease FtsH [Marinimicrobium sp. ABcell2]
MADEVPPKKPSQGDQNLGPLPDARRQPPQWLRYVNIILLGFVFFLLFQWLSPGDAEQLSFTEFKNSVTAGQVQEVTLEGHQVRGELVTFNADGQAQTQAFYSHIPEFADSTLLNLLEEHNVHISAEETGGDLWAGLLIGFLPWLILLLLIFYFAQRMQKQMGGGDQSGGMFSFGRSKAKRFRADQPSKTFEDIAGAENAKQDLWEIVEYLRDPSYYRRLGAKLPRGLLMVGPPGTGKTIMARAVAGEAKVPFFSISGSEFIEMFVGVGASRVRDMFEQARKEAPAIIFIDELDAIGRSRGTGVGGGHDEREQTLNQILSEMDGFSPHETVVVIAATNRPDVLDPALMRPGRFDRKVILDRPHREAREKILQVHVRKVPLNEDVDLAAIARRTVGFSGADLENLVNEAALLAGRENADQVNMDHFDRARDKILMGAEREQNMGPAEKRVIAYHESGHALTALLFPKADPLEKVTIIPRGQALGATEQAQDEDRLNMSASYARDRIAVMLGGRMAEKLIFHEVSSGAESDIEQATKLARRMVSRWGMSEAVGPVSCSSSQEEVFLGREIARDRDFSEATLERVDAEVHRLITGIEADVERCLTENRDKLSLLAETLLEEETLDAARVDDLLGKNLREQKAESDARRETPPHSRSGNGRHERETSRREKRH